jgi:hypothetical protein
MMQHNIAMKEVLYPFQRPDVRFHPPAVPTIMQTTLPLLTEDYDAFYDEVQTFVSTLPVALIGQQYQALFNWLCVRFQKQLWVERSGGSLRIIRQLLEHFPDARFVHLVRDGRDCAISMSKHYGFRMVLITYALTELLMVDPFTSSDRSALEDVPEELYPFLPEHFNAEEFRQYYKSPALYANYWSGELTNNLPMLAQLPSDRVFTLRFEAFFDGPVATIRQFISFVGPELTDDTWIQRMANVVHLTHSHWRELSPRELKHLEDACAPGNRALSSVF